MLESNPDFNLNLFSISMKLSKLMDSGRHKRHGTTMATNWLYCNFNVSFDKYNYNKFSH